MKTVDPQQDCHAAVKSTAGGCRLPDAPGFCIYNNGIKRSVMYRFDKMQEKDGTWRFQLGDINMILEGYVVDKDSHMIQNPEKAIAYFNVGGHVYGVSNQFKAYDTAEEFYDVMIKQYSIFNPSGTTGIQAVS